MKKTKSKARAAGPARKVSVPAVVLGAALAAGLGWMALRQGRPTPAPTPPSSSVTQAEAPATPPASGPGPALPKPAAQAAATPAVSVRPSPPKPAVIVPATQLVARLTALEAAGDKLSASEANTIDQVLRQLAGQGVSSVPAIRAYLDRMQDLSLSGHGRVLGMPTLRSALIGVLDQIGGPEAAGAMSQALQATADPYEIALLGQCLERQEPGKHQAEVLAAATESLKLAAQEGAGDRDVGPLFVVLEKAAGAEGVDEIVAGGSRWNHYSSLALAATDAGIEALVRRLDAQGKSGTSDSQLDWQVLAQSASRSQAARDALLERARSGSVPDVAWKRIAEGLMGDQYAYGDPRLREQPIAGDLPGLKTYHIRVGNQNFYSLPVGVMPGARDVPERLAVVDSLVALDLPPTAREALQAGRATLTAAGRHP